MVNTILAKRVNHIVAKGGNPACPKGSKSRGFSRQDRVSGKYVTVRHGDFSVSYCHLSECRVARGDCVRPGDVVGISGNTGRSTGPHLHLTVRMGRRHINPGILLQFIDKTRQQALEKLSE
ncbi:M23 family metallopeptidase [Paraprevotella clara]|uniref:M23 family metallopeptidase n=1 Tax=Paraprevotella clara TaxID=454154 RepID=UPI003AB704A8